MPTGTAADYEHLARDLVLAHDTQDQAALQRLNAHYHRSFTFDDLGAEIWRRVYAFRQRSSSVPKNHLQINKAGKTLLDRALARGFTDSATVLRAHGASTPDGHRPRRSASQTPGGLMVDSVARHVRDRPAADPDRPGVQPPLVAWHQPAGIGARHDA